MWAQLSVAHWHLVCPHGWAWASSTPRAGVPGRCPRVPECHCCSQTHAGPQLPFRGTAGSAARGCNSSCSLKSDKCLVSDRETTLTSHGSLPFSQCADLQPSADMVLWGNVELLCTAHSCVLYFWSSFRADIFFFLNWIFSPQRMFWSCKQKSSLNFSGHSLV